MSDGKPLSTESYKGVRDFYPVDWRKQQYMFETQRKLLLLSGFEEYQASPLEHTEIYENKGNEEIIRDQTYTFTDRGERRVTLRPEMTPTLARMVAHKRRELVFPLRWFSIGNRFRYERPQRGRGREFYQTDIDFLGVPEGSADIEILTLAHRIVSSFGATNDMFRLRVGSRTLLNAACEAVGLATPEEVGAFRALLDRKDKMTSVEWNEEMDGKANPLLEIESPTHDAVRTEKERVLSVIETLRAQGLSNVEFDPTIVRGFDYYTGIVFEMWDTHPDNTRSVFGGGRYDRLVEMFSSEKIPAIGFAIGDMPFENFLSSHNLFPDLTAPTKLYVGTVQGDDVASAELFASTLQNSGVSTWVNVLNKKLGDQIKEADKRSIPFFVAYGKDEASSGTLRIKHLATGEETEVQKADVSDFLNTHS